MSEPPILFDRAAQILRAERASPRFDDADFLHRRAAEGLMERLSDVSRRFERAVVVGSGGGVYARALRSRGDIETVRQIEPMPAFAERAGAEIAEGAAALDEGSVDLALSGLSLHRENDPVGQLIQIRRALAPDSLFLGATFGAGTLKELRAALAEAEAEVEGGLSPRVAPMADIRDLGGLLQRAGFAMPVADSEPVTVDYADPFALMRDLRAMGESNALAERRRSFTRRATLMRAAEIYAAHFSRPDGRIVATFEIVYLAGWSPGPDQPVAKRPGSATTRLADALGAIELPAGDKAGPAGD